MMRVDLYVSYTDSDSVTGNRMIQNEKYYVNQKLKLSPLDDPVVRGEIGRICS